MLDKFAKDVGETRLDVPAARGLTFYQVMTLASIVEREAVLDEERAAHRRRLPEPAGRPARHQAQDPQRGSDGPLRDRHDGARQARLRRVEEVRLLEAARDAARRRRPCPTELAGLPDVHRRPACIPGPICTPSLPSIDAALEPDTAAATCTSWRSPTAAARTPSPRRRPSTTPTGRSTATSRDGLARPGRLRRAAVSARPSPPGRRPTARPARPGWPASGRASRTPASTPTSASGASTCAT